MRNTAMSRRTMLGAGVCALAAAAGIPHVASARAETGQSAKNEETIRKWYAAWERKDWHPDRHPARGQLHIYEREQRRPYQQEYF